MNTVTGRIKEKQQDILNTQMNAPEQENKLNSGKIVDIQKEIDSPFSIVTDEDGACFITVGNKRVTEQMEWAEAKLKIKNKDWDILTALIVIVAEATREELTKQ